MIRQDLRSLKSLGSMGLVLLLINVPLNGVKLGTLL